MTVLDFSLEIGITIIYINILFIHNHNKKFVDIEL